MAIAVTIADVAITTTSKTWIDDPVRRYQEDELINIKTMFYMFKQGNSMSLQRYYELFVRHVMVMDEVGIRQGLRKG